MTRRIYFDSLWKKLLLAGGVGTTTIITFLLTFLAMSGAIEITGYSEDTVCAGTDYNPCYAYINFTAKEDIFIYPLNHTGLRSENVPITFKPDVQDWTLYRSWGDGWRTINLSKPWSTKVKYAIKFSEGKEYQVRIKVLKNSPADTVKWSFGSLDPAFLAVEKTDIITDSYVERDKKNPNKFCVHRTTCNPTDLDYTAELYPIKEDYKSITKELGFEVEEEYKYNETVSTQKCTTKEIYDEKNNSYYNQDTCITIENIVPKIGLRWVSAIDYAWSSKTCYKTRQCIERANNLDDISTELHVPFLGYDLKEYTTITASGHNQSILDFTGSVDYYKLEESSLNYIDSVGTIDFTAGTAPTKVTGIIDFGQDFESGSSHYMSTATSTSVEVADPVISMWIKPETIQAQYISYNFYNGGGSTFYGYVINMNSGGQIVMDVYGGGSAYDRWTSDAISAGSWHNIFISFNSSSGDISMQINASISGGETSEGVSNIAWSSGNHYRTLGSYQTSGLFFDGIIDELYLASSGQTITQAQIDYLYNNGAPETSQQYDFDILGAFNSSGTFNTTNITADCTGDSNYFNWSQNKTSFQTTTTETQIDVGEQIRGFYLSVDKTACTWVFLEVSNVTSSVAPVVEAISPANASSVGVASQTFSCNITSVNVSSMSLYLNDTINITNTSKVVGDYNFTTTITVGDNSWLCQGCNDYPTQSCTNTAERIITYGFSLSQSYCSPYSSFTDGTNFTWQYNADDFSWDVNTFRFNTSGVTPDNLSKCMFNMSHNYITNKSLNITLNESFTPTYTPGSILVSCYNVSNLSGGTNTVVDGAWDGTRILANCTMEYINVSFNESDYAFNITWVIG